MKKLLAVFILCAMLIAVLASCAQKEGAQKPPKGDNTQDTVDDNRDDGGDQNGGQTGFEDFKIPAGLSGADVAKLLLANERLNSQLLKNEGDIFENGAQVFRNLAETAEENLVLSAPTLIATPMRYKTLSPVPMAEIKDVGNEGIIEIDGNFYRWSGFEENNNSYEAFQSMTDGIIHSSKMAAELIDNIKKNVRVVDKWVSYGDIKHYLHVDENSELLVELREGKEDTNLEICKRYKNESGKDVYELYVEYACERYVAYSRILYIPGQRYEFSTMHDLGEEVQENYFVADNSKGYWETYTVGVMPTHYNISCFVMKDDISYDSFYDPVVQKINYLKVMSADRATDILHIMGDPADGTVFVELLFAGFNGVKNIEIEASADEIVTDLEAFYSLSREEQMKYKLYISNGYYGLVGNEAGTVNMANGKQLRFGDSFLDGKIKVDAIRASNSDVYNHGSIGLRVEAASCEQILDYITAFIEEVGLECKRDTDETLEGISRAYTELAGFTSYYKWNGIVVDNEPAIDDAVVIEREKFGKLKAFYEPVKNA